ncbi:uncharacterized protein LOC122026266 isoform X1 [Zingiber officinale]|uniref:uncharacterized protein LOC122026266 isoform X1 n=1 Tax=Zingiber officinale TaxID=94328 RepID=UPI001C4D6D31|nr:uncharacterized protein LOC122026266 isoform X1 [Zingiber officinale]
MGQGTEPRDRSAEHVEKSERRESVECMEQILDPQVDVAEFDYSVENFFAAMDKIGDLCGTSAKENFDSREIERFSPMVTFLKEWKYFYYDPKIINFTSEQVKDLPKDIRLPQFSAASVPKMTRLPEETKQSDSNDFILHAGGLVWALDWCPRNQEQQGQEDCKIKCEYLAVAAHPSTSAYHKIGAPLLGRGVIQIWCLFNCDEDIEIPLMRTQGRGRPRKEPVKPKSGTGKPRGRPRKKPVEEKPTAPRPRGRPRKRPVSSSDEEYTFTGSKKLLGTLDQNGLKDLSLLNPLVSPERSLAETSISETVTSTRKSRRVPKKNTLVTVDLDSEEEPSSISNGNGGTSDLVGYSCVDSRCTSSTMNLSFSSSIKCTEQLMQPRRRGRPRKKPMLSASVSAASCLALSTGDTVQCSSKEPSAVDGKELSASCNNVIMTQDNALSLTGPQVNSLSLHDSVPEKYNVTDTQAKHRGRPRKKLAFSVPEPRGTSGDKHAHNDNFASPSVAPSETEVTVLPYLSRFESSMTVENALSSSTEPHNKSADAQCKGETIQAKSRGRTRKRPVLKLDTFDLVKCTELTKDIDETCRTINKDQEELNSVSFGIKQSGEDNKKNEERCGFENPVSSDFCRDQKLPDDCSPNQENHSENSIPLEKTISKEETVCSSIAQGLTLPRVVFCLAHNGKVAWDVKWRPTNGNTTSKECMGYLAVLLGNGSLEVRWEIPLPGMVKTLFTSKNEKGTDPRFLKLTPWFRCSTVKRGDKQSIPLSMEWSPAFPHDLILAGCHDGTVLVWKFSTQCSTQDARPLLCFVADSAPIRALAWAPETSHAKSENVFVTAGNEGLKFWDLRDPYRPLWELNPIQRAVLSLDWVKDPRCIVMGLDDGTMRILSLCNAANDVPVTGQPFAGSKYQGLHSFSFSLFAIWSVHVSESTGFVAYCCADGRTIRFQLTTRFVDKDPSRGRTPHFLCGSLLEENGSLKIYTPSSAPLQQVPVPQKKSSNGLGTANSGAQLVFDNEQTELALSQISGDGAVLSICSAAQAPQIKATQKSRDNKKKNEPGQMTNQLTIANKGRGLSVKSKTKTKGSEEEFQVFPPKILAIHRVRWNKNKGSQRWLCYGGTAGILRCQQIPLV